MINVLVKYPGKPWEKQSIANDLETLQMIVGGYIQIVPMGSRKDHAIICDEEGRLKDYDFNVILQHTPFVGNVILVGLDDEGEICDVRESFADVLDGSELGAVFE